MLLIFWFIRICIWSRFRYELWNNKSEEGELEELKQKVLDGEIDAIMYYDKDFDDLVNTETLPKVEVLYDSTSTTSGSASNKALTIISIHQ